MVSLNKLENGFQIRFSFLGYGIGLTHVHPEVTASNDNRFSTKECRFVYAFGIPCVNNSCNGCLIFFTDS